MKRLMAIGILATVSMFALDAVPDGDQEDGASPVPEPTTIGLMGAGLAAFGYAAWCKGKKR